MNQKTKENIYTVLFFILSIFIIGMTIYTKVRPLDPDEKALYDGLAKSTSQEESIKLHEEYNKKHPK